MVKNADNYQKPYTGTKVNKNAGQEYTKGAPLMTLIDGRFAGDTGKAESGRIQNSGGRL
ncbi:MAG: hypothetical protein GY841_18290 [FCB group bacterium]|nr:hypothetical protein [FCB group bacterium]